MLQVQDLGNSSYKRTWELQKELQLQRIENKIDDTLLLVEHEPVYTFGKNTDENHLLQNYPENVKLFHIVVLNMRNKIGKMITNQGIKTYVNKLKI